MSDDDFGDPVIAASEQPADSEPFLFRVNYTRFLYPRPTSMR
jgi:hypothetical protein